MFEFDASCANGGTNINFSKVSQLEMQRDVLQKLREGECKRRSETSNENAALYTKIENLEAATEKILRQKQDAVGTIKNLEENLKSANASLEKARGDLGIHEGEKKALLKKLKKRELRNEELGVELGNLRVEVSHGSREIRLVRAGEKRRSPRESPGNTRKSREGQGRGRRVRETCVGIRVESSFCKSRRVGIPRRHSRADYRLHYAVARKTFNIEERGGKNRNSGKSFLFFPINHTLRSNYLPIYIFVIAISF